MRVLVACEESQEVCKAFRALGHETYSCDIEPCSGGHPEWHLQCDALELLKMQWDMILAFPPCTDLAVSGAKWFAEKRADGRQQKSIEICKRKLPTNRHRKPGWNHVYGLAKTGPDYSAMDVWARRNKSNLSVAEGLAFAYPFQHHNRKRAAGVAYASGA